MGRGGGGRDEIPREHGGHDAEGRWAEFKDGVFEAALLDTEVVIQPRESNTWGALSLDHVYEFMGGLALAARHVTGKDPDACFDDFREPAARARRSLEGKPSGARLGRRCSTPSYVADLQQGGASSAEKFAETFRNVYGWNVMKPSAIDQELWNELYATYVDDVHGLGVRDFFARVNPYAMQEMTAVMVETARKGYWKASDVQLIDAVPPA